MKKIMVALITPFQRDHSIDYPSLRKIIQRLLNERIDGFIVCGTTGESATLSWKEKKQLLSFVIQVCDRNTEIWFGCGSNDTQETIQQIKDLQDLDFTGIMLVVPYYNRPSQNGIYMHFHEISNATDKKIMLYNIPSRCGVEIQCETLLHLLQSHSNIVALKHASHELELVKIIKLKYPDFLIYSGEDGFFEEGFDAGMDGLISVMAHVNLPKLQEFLHHDRIRHDLFKDLKSDSRLVFLDASPSCIKYILFKRGECENVLRLPMTPVSKDTAEILDRSDMIRDFSHIL